MVCSPLATFFLQSLTLAQKINKEWNWRKIKNLTFDLNSNSIYQDSKWFWFDSNSIWDLIKQFQCNSKSMHQNTKNGKKKNKQTNKQTNKKQFDTYLNFDELKLNRCIFKCICSQSQFYIISIQFQFNCPKLKIILILFQLNVSKCKILGKFEDGLHASPLARRKTVWNTSNVRKDQKWYKPVSFIINLYSLSHWFVSYLILAHITGISHCLTPW